MSDIGFASLVFATSGLVSVAAMKSLGDLSCNSRLLKPPDILILKGGEPDLASEFAKPNWKQREASQTGACDFVWVFYMYHSVKSGSRKGGCRKWGCPNVDNKRKINDEAFLPSTPVGCNAARVGNDAEGMVMRWAP